MLPSLDRLAVLEVLLRTRSPGLAARELDVTPSAVSKVLAQLRIDLGDRLLVRRGDRMVPTPLAERIASPLSASLVDLRRLLEGDEATARPRKVAIAMRDQFVVALGPAILRGLAQDGNVVELHVIPYERERVSEQLARGTVDLAVGVDPPDTPGIKGTLLYEETFVCLAPMKRKPTMRDYLRARHVSTSAHAGYAGIDAVLAKKGFARVIAARVPYFVAAVELAATDSLFATVPLRVALALRPRRLVQHALPFPAPGFRVTMTWDMRCDDDPTNRWLRGVVLQAAHAPQRRA